MQDRLKFLIDLLMDKTTSIADRDDAAMDLFEFNEDDALDALIKIAQDTNEDPTVLNSCGESIASIWVKRNKFDKNCFDNLTKEAQCGIYYVIKQDRPDWLNGIKYVQS